MFRKYSLLWLVLLAAPVGGLLGWLTRPDPRPDPQPAVPTDEEIYQELKELEARFDIPVERVESYEELRQSLQQLLQQPSGQESPPTTSEEPNE